MPPICIISGCSRGIGRAIATKLAASGYSLGLLARNEQQLESLKEEVSKNGLKHIAIPCDICNEKNIQTAVSAVAKELGPPTKLVNVAGINVDGIFMRYSTNDMNSLIQTNLIGTMCMTKTVLPYMMRSKSGSIVSIGSVVGSGGRSGQVVYAATKSALIGYSRSIAKEMGRYNIRSNVVAPGFIDTEMTQNSIKDKDELVKKIALRRMGSVDEVAAVVQFLLSDEASYVTGSILHVDGGIEI